MKLKKADTNRKSVSKALEGAVSNLFLKDLALKKKEKVLAALSGGPDSMALIHALGNIRKELGISFIALHLNHRLRGRESLRDENFVRNYCRRNNIPLAVEKKDIRSIARKNGKGIEETARAERYGFFERQAGRFKSRVVFTAHTRDDQVETVLMRLFRGTGISGAGGMKELSRRGPLLIARPFLSVSKKDIMEYNRENRVPFVVDSSNKDTAFTRNRFRLRIIPYLKKELGSSFPERIADFSDICRDFGELFRKNMEGVLKKDFSFAFGRLSFPCTIFKELPFYAACEAVRSALEKHFRRVSLPEKRVLENIMKNLLSLQPGRMLPLSKELVFLKERERIFVLRKKELSKACSLKVIIDPNKGAECDFFDVHLILKTEGNGHKRNTGSKKAMEDFRAEKKVVLAVPLPPALAGKQVIVRSFRDGDRITFVSRGRPHTKKVQDIFVDAKIPLFMKKRIPIVEYGGKIILIAGW